MSKQDLPSVTFVSTQRYSVTLAAASEPWGGADWPHGGSGGSGLASGLGGVVGTGWGLPGGQVGCRHGPCAPSVTSVLRLLAPAAGGALGAWPAAVLGAQVTRASRRTGRPPCSGPARGSARFGPDGGAQEKAGALLPRGGRV